MRWIKLTAAAGLAAGLLWWLFGWRTFHEGPFTTVARRSFGRYTSLEISTARFRTLHLFHWRESFVPGSHPTPIPSCFGERERWQDSDGDGRWDVWVSRLPADAKGECGRLWLVDLNRDEKADWRFTTHWMDGGVQDRIRASRGW